jgi:hypothetical protein
MNFCFETEVIELEFILNSKSLDQSCKRFETDAIEDRSGDSMNG